MRTVRIVMLLLFFVSQTTGCGCSDKDIVGSDATIYADGPWDPVIESLGEPGWGDSSEPWCADAPIALNAFDVWSDGSAVYVLGEFFYTDEHTSTSGCPSEHCYGRLGIYQNSGSGWTPFWEQDEDDVSEIVSWMSGIPDGPLLLVERDVYCEFSLVWPARTECALPDGAIIQDAFVVNSGLAYAIKDDKVIYWDGSEWGPYPAAYTPYTVTKIWADEEEIFCAGPDGVVVSLEGEDWIVHDTGTLRGMSAIWGFNGTDVWASGGRTGLMHFDGATWNEIEWPNLAEPGDVCTEKQIREFWGKDGVLFFHTDHQFVMWDGLDFRTLGFWPAIMETVGDSVVCNRGIEISSIWGNSPNEVFLSVRDYNHITEDCGMEYLLWWDGSEFHWF